jgi:hypothetical protein
MNMNEYKNPDNEPPPRKSSNAWVWILVLALFVPMFLCAGLCGGLMLFRVKTVEVAEQRAKHAVEEARQAATQAAHEAGQRTPYFQTSLKRVQSDIDVKTKLGEPIRQTGSSKFRSQKGPDGSSAELDYEVRGPNGKASVHGVAVEIDDQWWFEKLDVTCEDGETIDLADVEIPIQL